MKEERIKQLMAMPISRPVLNSVMLVKKCDELNARVFLESHYTCRSIAETVNRLVREEVIKEMQLDYRGLIEKGLALEAPKDMYEN